MPKLPEGKQQMHAYIRIDVLHAFKNIVKAKYSDMYGMSSELEEAMRNWIAINNTHANVQNLALNPQPRAFTIFQKVRKYLADKYFYGMLEKNQQVPLKMITESISAIKGSDKRTIRKWLEEFARYKLIKEISANLFEMM